MNEVVELIVDAHLAIYPRKTLSGAARQLSRRESFSSEQLWDRIEEYFLGLPIQGFDAASTASAESR